ncbi:C4-dicarboxylate ABC transporter substrate-binding protein [Sporosarcina sp. P12(2017)]|uniref:TRAP transporter substrate-binding protein n=1 Tax=unclassified Sporosarcina TaxID=2647733 RepID=UPI000C16C38F|nr:MULTISPECIES: DctP family TRAP transporter solute-binding subunit [unclassified Sporosarcina]PIC58373.1 C4-dicarboxylate ABC transporter substrate-binding protein [Sporosarcina sp. P10]PIC61462.1 C4-dicarboxylate ABC transporter substrate-binding protein [Sporosarcina sp. P12(2017)]
MKRFLPLVFIMILVLAACGRPGSGSDSASDTENSESDSTYKIRLPHLVSEEQSSHVAALDFKEKVEKDSNGEIEVEIYPNGSLFGSDREAIEAVQLGNVEMTIPAVAPLASFNDHFMVFDLPFLFDDNEAAYRALDGEVGDELLKELEEKNLKGLVFGENGFRHMSNNKGPITQLSDLKGLKLRTLENPLHTDTFKAFGANASPFAFGELYTALQQGTYDAMESPISLYYLNKFYEVQSDLTLTGHVYAATILLMNNDFYNELPEDLQEIVMTAAEEYRTEQRKLAQKQDKEFMDDLKELGMKIHEMKPEQREVFRKATEGVYEKYTPIIGEELVEKARAANEQ